MTSTLPSPSPSPSSSPNPPFINSTQVRFFAYVFDSVWGSYGTASVLYNGTNVVAQAYISTKLEPNASNTWFTIQDSQAPSATGNSKLAIQNVFNGRDLSDGITGDTKDPNEFRWNIENYPRPLPTSLPPEVAQSNLCCVAISTIDDNNTKRYLTLPDAFIQTAFPATPNHKASESFLILSNEPFYPLIMQPFSV